MAVDDYNGNDMHHMRRDVRDAHSDAKAAKLLATLALIGSLIALGFAIAAWNKANDAASSASRALEVTSQVQ